MNYVAYYDYNMLSVKIRETTDNYPFIRISSTGKSVQGRDLHMLRIGEGENEIFFIGAHHASDNLISALLIRFIEEFSEHYIRGTRLMGYSMRSIYQRSSIYIMPMGNPDGVDMMLSGYKAYENWQANARGVDLEHNYDASWETGKKQERSASVFGPSSTGYGGRWPESEPEVAAVTNFVRNHQIKRLLSFQTGGKVIDWDYDGVEPFESYAFGLQLEKVSGYRLAKPNETETCGSCKDWFIKEFRRPGYAIYVGSEESPLSVSSFDSIYKNLLELFIISSII